ncbi:MAG: SEL1-like repeat protein [Alphaproteobacteria bacterium]|nr:SEL1-like repeat protein [Alphaproteobacteria bacterium]
MVRLLASAEKGDPKAQYQLGLAYAKGHGTVVNVNEALRWWRQAAKTCKKKPPCRLQPPAEFKCKNGQRFTITFVDKKELAYLALPNSTSFEVLHNAKLGTGIGYDNERFDFEQHEGRVTFDAPESPKHKGGATVCRELAKKKTK